MSLFLFLYQHGLVDLHFFHTIIMVWCILHVVYMYIKIRV